MVDSNSPNTAPAYPSTGDWEHANDKQRARAERSLAQMKKRLVPVYAGPLFGDDEDEAVIQTAQNVARRTLVLWAVELRAEGVPDPEVRAIIDDLDLWEFVSENERRFLDDDDPSPEECQALVWRLESLWVLMWALGHIQEIPWPSGMCDVPKLAGILAEHEDDPSFILDAKLRPTPELLDARDLTMRIHWAIRNEHLQHGMVPEELDWSGDPEWIPSKFSAAVGVVEQRHYVLNWLTNTLSPESWDKVDTPT